MDDHDLRPTVLMVQYDTPDTSTPHGRRVYRAMRQPMTVLADHNGHEAIGVYDVHSDSGSNYTVDLDYGDCTCPDEAPFACKHQIRVALAIRHTPVPAPGEFVLGEYRAHLKALSQSMLARIELRERRDHPLGSLEERQKKVLSHLLTLNDHV
jgi:hypothetical protein